MKKLLLVLASLSCLGASPEYWVARRVGWSSEAEPVIKEYRRQTGIELKQSGDHSLAVISQQRYLCSFVPRKYRLEPSADRPVSGFREAFAELHPGDDPEYENELAVHETLARKHGDTLDVEPHIAWYQRYKTLFPPSRSDSRAVRERRIQEGLLSSFPGLSDDFIRINVVSDSDWDEAHPAGKPLDDLVVMEGISLLPYVSGDLRALDGAAETADRLKHYRRSELGLPFIACAFRKPVPELTREEMSLLTGFIVTETSRNIGYLDFETLPKLDSVHRISVILESDAGRLFVASAEMTFPLRDE